MERKRDKKRRWDILIDRYREREEGQIETDRERWEREREREREREKENNYQITLIICSVISKPNIIPFVVTHILTRNGRNRKLIDQTLSKNTLLYKRESMILIQNEIDITSRIIYTYV